VNGGLQNGILLYHRVASADHLTIDLCNFSGTTPDPDEKVAVLPAEAGPTTNAAQPTARTAIVPGSHIRRRHREAVQ